MKKLMVAFAVAGAMAFGALADIVITKGTLSGGANQLDTSRDLIFGKVPVSVQNNKEGSETSNTDRTVLTDGIADNTSPYVNHIYTVGKAVIVYSLGDNATGYDVDEVICHFGWGDNARAKVTCSKIRYAMVGAPDTFVDAGITASAGGSGANNYVKFAFEHDSVLKGVCKIEMTLIDGRSGYGTDYCGVLELIVNGTECEPVQYFELNDIPVVNAETRSTAFLNGTDLDFVSKPSVAGAQKWTRQDAFDFDALETATWSAIEDFPVTFSFTRPAADADVFVWYWFDSDEEGYIKRVARTAPMRYTTVKPAVSTVESLVRTVRGGTVRVEASECDTGTTGGVSSGDGLESLDIPVLTNLLELVSGPGADLDPDPSVVTVSETGSYVLRFISYNSAGNCATNDIPYSVDTLPVGVTFTWTGAESTDWYAHGNWDRGCFPVATDSLVIPAGCSNYPRLDAIDHPRDGGAYGSLAVAEGASIAFAGNPAFVNEPSGGTAAKPHGRGPSLSCASADIEGTLTADHLGFPRSTGPSQNTDVAGHGNAGWIDHPNKNNPTYQTFGNGLVAYGNPLEPTALGSGGAQGAGGGAIKLVCAGDLKLDGAITASATTRGSGGSIWIVCGGEFSGAGAVRADAPTVGDRSSSGGRIAIYHGSSTFTGAVSAAGGWTGQLWSNGGVGTLYEPGRYPLGTAENPADITFDGGFNYVFENEEPHYWNLTVTPGSRGGFKAGNLHLGDFAMGGDLTYLEFGTLVPGQARDMQTLEFDSITLTDSAILRLPGGYNGARKFAISSLSIGPSARLNTGLNDWSYVDEAHGGTASAPLGRGVEIACERATIDGVLSVSCQGYGLGYGPNPNQDYGSGHGGAAAAQNNIGQRGYGSFSAPTTLGCCYTGDGACLGGGAVRLSVSDTLALSGTIEADSNGRGSGGSVWIVANHFTGSGKLTAGSTDANARRPGAGGRIAIEAVDDQFKGTIAAKIVAKWGDNKSYPGTVFRSTAPSFAAIDFDVGAEKLTSSYAKNVFNSSVESDWDAAFGTQFVINRQITSWKGTSYAWTESCGLASGKTVANTATYVLDNLTPNVKARITVDGVTTSQRVDADGKLTFSAAIAAGGTDVEVRFSNGLMLLIR